MARGLFELWRGETGLVTPLFELAKGDTLTDLQRATLVLMPEHARLAYNDEGLLVSLQRPHEAETELRRSIAARNPALGEELAARLAQLLAAR